LDVQTLFAIGIIYRLTFQAGIHVDLSSLGELQLNLIAADHNLRGLHSTNYAMLPQLTETMRRSNHITAVLVLGCGETHRGPTVKHLSKLQRTILVFDFILREFN
jgi:hypothetical protein